MDLTFKKDDLADLSAVQKDSILQSMFLALGIDREIDSEELARFEKELSSIPWGIEPQVIKDMVQAARVRRKLVSGTEETMAWIRELAGHLPTQAVKEKTLAAMARIAMAHGLSRPERGLLNTFAAALELPAEHIDEMRQALQAEHPSESVNSGQAT